MVRLAPALVFAQEADAAAKGTQIRLAPVAVEAAPTSMDPVTAVRDAFTSILTGPSLSVQPLSARHRRRPVLRPPWHSCPCWSAWAG